MKHKSALEIELKLRIPGWATHATASVNGEPVALTPLRGYAAISRRYSSRIALGSIFGSAGSPFGRSGAR